MSLALRTTASELVTERPKPAGQGSEHRMHVADRHRVGVRTDSEDLRQRQQAILNPLLAILEAAPGQRIRRARERAARPATDAVVLPMTPCARRPASIDRPVG